MPMQRVDCDNIGDLDEGASRSIINRAINDAMRDLDDRGSQDELPRKVVIELDMSIKEDRMGIKVAAFAKLPPRKTRTTVAVVQNDAEEGVKALFRGENAANPEQPSLEFPSESTGQQ